MGKLFMKGDLQKEEERKSIKFLFLSDTHFGVHYAVKPRNMLRHQYGKSFFNKVEQIFQSNIRKNKIDFILHGGDFFNRSEPFPDVVKKATSSLLWAAKYVPIYLIPGNHERSKLPIGLLEYHENIHIFSKPCSYLFEKDEFRVKIAGFPYIRHHAQKKIKPVVSKAWKNEITKFRTHPHYSILLMHQLVQGSRVEHYTFNRGHNVVKSRDIPPYFDLVATGHVHRYQSLYEDNKRIVSSHTQHRMSQNVPSKTWCFISSSKQESKSFPNPMICYSGSCERVSMMERNEDKGYIYGRIDFNETINHQSLKMELEFIPQPSVIMKYLKWDLTIKPLEQSMDELKFLIQKLYTNHSDSSLAGIIHVSIQNPESTQFSEISPLVNYAKEKGVLLTFRWKKKEKES